jgi:CRP-like cAMP-binding protein
MYFVLRGTFEVVIAGIRVRTLSEGDYFGELALFTKK